MMQLNHRMALVTGVGILVLGLGGCNAPPPDAVSDAVNAPIEQAEDVSLTVIEQNLRTGAQTYTMGQGKLPTGFTDFVAQSPQTIEDLENQDRYTVFLESIAKGSDRSQPCTIQPELIRCPTRIQVAIFHWQNGQISSEAAPLAEDL